MPTNPSINPIYESYSMLHPNGDFMCYVGSKRANWYVAKDLAVWVDENQKTFKLKFAPNGNGKRDLPFYNQTLENKCVVCGDCSNNLNKHHVVPYVFRSRFPNQYKESNHHDIVVTCLDCHEKYEHLAMDYKIKLVHDAGFVMNNSMSKEAKHNKKIISARKMLEKIKSGQMNNPDGSCKVPSEKIKQFEDDSQAELLEDNNPFLGNALWADQLVDKIINENKIFEFVKLWRQHFIDNAQPKFLPDFWSLDHPLESSEKSINKAKL